MPVRIQQRRVTGWRKPPGARSVARNTAFGNPFPVSVMGDPAAHADAVARFRAWIIDAKQASLRDRVRRELRGLDLICWCPPGVPCHADVLIEIANAE